MIPLFFSLDLRRLNMVQRLESILHRFRSFHFDVRLKNFLHKMHRIEITPRNERCHLCFQGHFALELFVIDMKFKRKCMISHKEHILRCYLLFVRFSFHISVCCPCYMSVLVEVYIFIVFSCDTHTHIHGHTM